MVWTCFWPFSLTCVTSKLMEHIICSNLTQARTTSSTAYNTGSENGAPARRCLWSSCMTWCPARRSPNRCLCAGLLKGLWYGWPSETSLRQGHHKSVDLKLPRGQDTVGCCWRGRVGQSASSVRDTSGVRFEAVPLPVLYQRHCPRSHLHHQAICGRYHDLHDSEKQLECPEATRQPA